MRPGRPGTCRRAGASRKPSTSATTTCTPAARRLRGAILGRQYATQIASAALPVTKTSRNVSLVISPLSHSQCGTESRSAKEVPLGGHDQVARGPFAAGVDSTDHRGRDSGRLAEDELGRRGQLVGNRDHRRVEPVAGGITLTLEVEQRPDPGDTDGDIGCPLAPGPAERIADDHTDV